MTCAHCLTLQRRVRELEEEVAEWERLGCEPEDDRLQQHVKIRDWLRAAHRRAGTSGVSAILAELIEHPGRTASRPRLYEVSRYGGLGQSDEVGDKIIDVQIMHLRRALAARGYGRGVETVRALGFRLAPETAAALKAELGL